MRTLLTLVLIAYLAVLLLGPLTVPVGSAHLTNPMARVAAPIHRALFQGHGYRFFAPQPGPGHFVECRFQMSDGPEQTIRFPDRERHWPRLLYHRWFMLAETVFTELDGTPDSKSFRDAQQTLQREIDQLRSIGKLIPAKQLAIRRDDLQIEYERARARIDQLVRRVALAVLTEVPGATAVELVLYERSIPLPGDVADGVKLDDARYLSDPLPIGTFSREQLQVSDSDLPLEELP